MPEHTPAPTPSRAVYGFALQLSMRIVFIIYFLWAIIPEKYLEAIGITYMPQRYWTIAVPILFLTILTLFAFFIYPGLGLCMTPNIDEIKTITDNNSVYEVNCSDHNAPDPKVICVCKDKNSCEKKKFDSIQKDEFIKQSVPTISDIHISKISEHLYL